MPGRNQSALPAGSPASYAGDDDLKERMAVYDSFPSEIKELYDAFPLPMGVFDMQKMLRNYGVAGTKQKVLAFAQEHFPGWAPLRPNIRRKRKF